MEVKEFKMKTQKTRHLKAPGLIILSILIVLYTLVLEVLAFTTADCYLGGTITINGSYCIHTFKTNASFNITSPLTVEVLVVAGGGGGGYNGGGGGGAGGYNQTNITLTAGNKTVVIGTGGNNAGGGNYASNGTNSSFDTIQVAGGGGAGSSAVNGFAGGSGGGGGGSGGTGGLSLFGQGNKAGDGAGGTGGGGGGATSVGIDGGTSGNGGAGFTTTINGTSYCFAGGGGGGATASAGIATCGGSNGAIGAGTASNALANTGAGGGGAGNAGGQGGNGGSGIIIVKYLAGGITNSQPVINSSFIPQTITFGCNSTIQNISSIKLNVTGTSNWTQSITGLNTNNYNATFINTTIPVGSYTWNCIAQDLEGLNHTSTDWTFNIKTFVENSITYTNITVESAAETFKINFTYDPLVYPIIVSRLNYNGNPYLSTIIQSGTNYIATNSIEIPAITGAQQNNTFYWSFELTNSLGTIYVNSTNSTQKVNEISFGNCTGSNNILALNATLYDERTLNRLYNWSFQGTITYFIGNSAFNKIFNVNSINIEEQNICINTNITYRLTGVVEYSQNETYVTRNYYFIKTPVSNATTNLFLYLLPKASATSFILQVNDQNQLPVNGYFIYINKCFANNVTNCQTVQVSQTDTNGQSSAFLETETVLYQFLIYDTNGVLVFTSDRRKVIPQTTPYTIIFTIGELLPNPTSYLDTLSGVTYTLTFNKTSNIVSYLYSDTSGNFTSSRLVVQNLNSSGNNKILCDVNLTTPSGVIYCNLTGNQTGSYSATAYIYRGEQYFIDNIVFDIETFSGTAGMLGIFGAFVIILVCAFLFAFNEVAGIIAVNVAVFFVNIIGLVNFGPVFITAIIAISIIILITLERG